MAAYARYHYGKEIDADLLANFIKRRSSLMTSINHLFKKQRLTAEEFDVIRHYIHIADYEELKAFPLQGYMKGLIELQDLAHYVTEKPNFPADIRKNKGHDIDKIQQDLLELIPNHRNMMVSDDRLAQDFNYCIKYLLKRKQQYTDDFKRGKKISSPIPSDDSSSSYSDLEEVFEGKKVQGVVRSDRDRLESHIIIRRKSTKKDSSEHSEKGKEVDIEEIH